MIKAAFVGLALEGYLRQRGYWDFCRVKVKFGCIEIGFTKPFPPSFKTLADFKTHIFNIVEDCLNSLGRDDKYGPIKYFESPMCVVTRDTELWDKGGNKNGN